jgi:hypothetical protein
MLRFFFRFIGILDIQIVASFLDGSNIHLPADFAGLAVSPPLFDGIKFFQADGFGFAVGFLVFR